jgi:hypothetical protein
MTMAGFARAGGTLCMLLGFGTAVFASDDATVGAAAPTYDSNYTAHTKEIPSMAGNTPEDDGRPGVYYFTLGASAFMHNDYAHAIRMYEVAASWAYKPAAYNLAVMYARGQGVPVDLPRAMAWIALAAERNDQQYVDVRELIYSMLSKEQFAQANEIWRDLKKTYGDTVALPRAEARWADVRSHMTGSRVGSAAGPLAVGSQSTHIAHMYLPDEPHPIATGAAQVLTGAHDDGSIAYGQLRQSANPYDPKFELPQTGTATVGPLSSTKEEAPKADAPKPNP